MPRKGKKYIIKKKIESFQSKINKKVENSQSYHDKKSIINAKLNHRVDQKSPIKSDHKVRKNSLVKPESNHKVLNKPSNTKKNKYLHFSERHWRNNNKNIVNGKIFNRKYEKKKQIDYDVIIIISSYNRYDGVDSIIKSITSQITQYTYKIIVLNDGSTEDDYDKLVDNYNIELIQNEINYGKKKYWKSINKLFKKASNYSSHALLQIDDDFLLCDNFLDRVLNEFFRVKHNNNTYVAISYHLYREDHNNVKRWGLNNWIDGGGLYDSRFLECINYKIDEIDIKRWVRWYSISSGVWEQVSHIINNMDCKIYKLDHSLVSHEDGDISKMNYKNRLSKPLNTYNFKKNSK